MSAAPDIASARRDQRSRLRNLITQFGMSRAEEAALLRELAQERDPAAEYQKLREAAPAIAANDAGGGKPRENRRAERQRRYRIRRTLGLRTLHCYPAVSDEVVAVLVQHGLISASAVDRDAELVDEIVGIAARLAEALQK